MGQQSRASCSGYLTCAILLVAAIEYGLCTRVARHISSLHTRDGTSPGNHITVPLLQHSSASSTEQLVQHWPHRNVLTAGLKARTEMHRTITESVAKADAMLNSTREERSHRILVPLLAGSGKTPCCMLRNFDANIRGANPNVDVLVFSINNTAAEHEAECVLPNVYYMALLEHWGPRRRGSATATHLWSVAWADAGYRNMGHWRLTFQFAFADMLGYKYVWQVDDDTEFKAREPLNVTDYMQGKLVAGYHMVNDISDVTWGLPEFTRAFLVAERIVPRGALYTKHTNPPGLEGLYTVKPETANAGRFSGFNADPGGWDRFIIAGNCLVVDVSFMMDPLVQRFLEVVVSSQYHYRFRWNEQSVLGMLWQVFVPEEQIGKIPLNSWSHGNKHWTC